MKNISFLNGRGQQLAGVIHQPQKWAEGPTIIICHGFRGSKEGSGKAAVFAEEVVAKGYRVLRFDFAGSGASEGDFASVSLLTYMQDLASALDYLEKGSSGPYIVLGRSFGGTTALLQAIRDERISGVCTWGAPTDLMTLFVKPVEEKYGPLGTMDVYNIETEGDSYLLCKEFFEELLETDVLGEIGKLSPRPLLIVHGSEDEIVTMDQGIKLFEKARYPKELAIIAGADHRFTRNFRYVFDITIKWLEKYFPAKGF